MADRLLVTGLKSGYGRPSWSTGIDLSVKQGQSLAVLGRNGIGKTTLLNHVIGVTRRHAGSIMLDGVELTTLPSQRRAAAGIGWVPQERNIFRSLTVEENLTAVARPGPWDVKRVYEMFPRLAERKTQPRQPALGRRAADAGGRRARSCSTPSCCCSTSRSRDLRRSSCEELLASIGRVVRNEGMSAIIVEQNPRMILPITTRAVVLDRGQVVHEGNSAELLADRERLDRWLAVAKH